jgi:hypothetical protein
MAHPRRGELRLLHVMIVGIILILVGVPVLIFAGVLHGFWFLTKENMDRTIASGKGYTAAKTPTEAMDKFREAIHARDYKAASYYTTKNYGELLTKSHANARELGNYVDKIRNWGENKGLLTDKLKVALFWIDPFPKNIKSGEAPKLDGDKKAVGIYLWDPAYKLDGTPTNIQDMKELDLRMFTNILKVNAFQSGVKLVKDGDEWKLDIITTPQWEAEVSHFNDRARTYITGLEGLWNDLNRERIDTKTGLENEVLGKLRAAAK